MAQILRLLCRGYFVERHHLVAASSRHLAHSLAAESHVSPPGFPFLYASPTLFFAAVLHSRFNVSAFKLLVVVVIASCPEVASICSGSFS